MREVMKRIMSKFTLNLSGIQRSAMNQDDLKLLEYVTSSEDSRCKVTERSLGSLNIQTVCSITEQAARR
jgi:hypothetical protein